jgi:hypothetical protein
LGMMSDMKPGPLHERCLEDKGCERADRAQMVCPVYINPTGWWNRGGCPMATHWRAEELSKDGKVRVGQQKQKKRKK